jgi:membrane-bound lytic murein transglycosylase B
MSLKIESIGTSSLPGPTGEKKQTGDFEAQLQNFMARHSLEATTANQARLQMHMCQLQMARSLFGDAQEEDPEMLPELLPGQDEASTTGLAKWRDFDNAAPSGGRLTEAQPLPSGGKHAPADIESLIDRAAADHGVAPDLIRSVIRTESAFNPRAVSPAGAQGLMQLMPETAAELGVTDPFDPGQNVMAGTRYLRQLLDRYDGDLDHALAAYNWGMGNVDRHGLDRLPEETRNYLLRVKRA